MQILGNLKVGKESIFRAATICHALDVAAPDLHQLNPIFNEQSWQKEEYDRLLTEHLLQLAIILRSAIYQGLNPRTSEPFISCCGILDIDKGKSFNVKDVCDKIIHADYIVRHLEKGEVDSNSKTTFQIRGKHPKDGSWALGISIELFCVGILNWVDSEYTN